MKDHGRSTANRRAVLFILGMGVFLPATGWALAQRKGQRKSGFISPSARQLPPDVIDLINHP
jgi:hypothetical protein